MNSKTEIKKVNNTDIKNEDTKTSNQSKETKIRLWSLGTQIRKRTQQVPKSYS